MSQATEVIHVPGSGMSLWTRQVRAIQGLELRKSLFGRRALPLYLLAAMPVAIMLIRAAVGLLSPDALLHTDNIAAASKFFSSVFETFVVRLVIFFGCVAIFTNLFRGEVVDRSLHYYLLAPLRREVLAVGKYVAGVVSTGLVFTAMTAVAYLLLYLPSSQFVGSYLLGGPGLGHLAAYAGITLLACIGYGAVFMFLGVVFRNPVIPAAFILGWESINSLLPALAKKISIIYYLQALNPVPVDLGPLALVGDPISPWLAIPGLLVVCAALLAATALLVRRMEIRYGSD